jgi:hypothetical protein
VQTDTSCFRVSDPSLYTYSTRNIPDLLRDDCHDELVYARAQEEGEEHGRVPVEVVRANRTRVDVPEQESVHGLVPLS